MRTSCSAFVVCVLLLASCERRPLADIEKGLATLRGLGVMSFERASLEDSVEGSVTGADDASWGQRLEFEVVDARAVSWRRRDRLWFVEAAPCHHGPLLRADVIIDDPNEYALEFDLCVRRIDFDGALRIELAPAARAERSRAPNWALRIELARFGGRSHYANDVQVGTTENGVERRRIVYYEAEQPGFLEGHPYVLRVARRSGRIRLTLEAALPGGAASRHEVELELRDLVPWPADEHRFSLVVSGKIAKEHTEVELGEIRLLGGTQTETGDVLARARTRFVQSGERNALEALARPGSADEIALELARLEVAGADADAERRDTLAWAAEVDAFLELLQARPEYEDDRWQDSRRILDLVLLRLVAHGEYEAIARLMLAVREDEDTFRRERLMAIGSSIPEVQVAYDRLRARD